MSRQQESQPDARGAGARGAGVHDSREGEEVTLKVAVRLRPKLRRERKEAVFWEVDQEDKKLRCTADKSYRQSGNQRPFQRKHGPYAKVFEPSSKTEDVHCDLVAPVVNSFLDGFNGCIFAYGQTGSGKTHTLMGTHMFGPDSAAIAEAGGNSEERELGIIQRTVVQVLRRMKRDVTRKWFLRISYLEIYNEKLKDLLLGADGVQVDRVLDNSRPGGGLTIYDHPTLGPTVKNLTEVPITGIDQLHDLILMGERRRAVGRTNMNEHSSRSHTMFRLVLESAPLDGANESDGNATVGGDTVTNSDSEQVTVSQLYLVDLAGSENVKKSGVEGKRMREAAHINTSLAQLTLVITQLAERSEWETGSYRYNQIRIHYRASKLTHVLSGCLGGNARTVLICAVSPAENSMTETHSTLQFAERAARIVNHVAKVRVSVNDALIGKHMHDVEALRSALRGDASEESAALDKERVAMYRRTKEAEAAKATAQAEALEERQKVAEHRALLQAVSSLNTAFPESDIFNKAIHTRVVSPVHDGRMQASAGLEELAVVCSEDEEGMIGGEIVEPSKSKDLGWSATKVMNAALSESKESIESLRKSAAENRIIATNLLTLAKVEYQKDPEATGIDSPKQPQPMADEDEAYSKLCHITDALFGHNNEQNEGTEHNENAVHSDRAFLESVCEKIIVPLKNGSISSVGALASLETMCAKQDDVKGTNVYTEMFKNETLALGSDTNTTPSRQLKEAEQQRQPISISGYTPLPRDRSDITTVVTNTNIRVSTLEGTLEAMQAKVNRMEERLKYQGIRRIPKREDTVAGDKGRMCSGGDDNCAIS